MKRVIPFLLTFLLAFTILADPIKAAPVPGIMEMSEDSLIPTAKKVKGLVVKDYSAASENGIYCMVYIKNTSKQMRDINGTFKFYNGSKLIASSSTSATAISPGKTAILVVKAAEGSNKCKYKLSVRSSIYKYGNKFLEITETGGDASTFVVSIRNNAKKKLEFVRATVIFFKAGECVGYGYAYVPGTDLAKGEEGTVSINNWLDRNRTYDDYLISIEGRRYKG